MNNFKKNFKKLLTNDFFNITKTTVTRTVGLKNLERVAGWCEAMGMHSNDLSPLSRRTESVYE